MNSRLAAKTVRYGNRAQPLAFLDASVINEWVTQTTSDANLSDHRFDPSVKELTPAPSIIPALESLQHLPGCLLLDSSMQIQSSVAQPLGRFSFLMADPFDHVIVDVAATDPFQKIQSLLKQFRTDSIPDLPPMQGGLAGLFSYDLNRSLEKIPQPRTNEFELPAIAAGAYDTVVAWDHELNRCWVVSQGFPETESVARKNRANSRAEFFAGLLTSAEPLRKLGTQIRNETLAKDPSPSFEVDGPAGLVSNFSRETYMAAVKKCIAYIHAGDVFQINLAQRLLFPANASSIQLYQRLRQCNPAPFSGFFDLSQISKFEAQIISASPERFLSVRDKIVETRPIKGTRRRTGHPLVDIHAKKELLSSVKDRAENTMIVDLMRNDLSPVCGDDSIRVTQLCELEEYQSVLHLVSAVQGQLRDDCNLVDLIKSVFPGGSITGAPKVRAMEIIAELEPSARGAYCGSLGYLGFDGNADLSILIRTITASNGWWQIPVGGGIVSQSDPRKEYEETWTKAAGMLRAVSMSEAT